MAITWSPAPPLGQARTSSRDERGRRTYVRHFLAITDNALIGPKAVRDDCPVAIGQTYVADGESDTGSFATNITANEDVSAGDGCQWIVTVEYGPFNPLEFSPEDPMIERPKISFSSTRFQIPAIRDIYDPPIPVQNSAKDPFDPPVMIDQSRPFMTIVRNEPGYNPVLANDLHNTINDAPWFGMPELCWKCLDITGEQAVNPDGGRYWVVTYQFELNRETWVVLVLDQGMREIRAGKKVAITDDKGQIADSPWPLNEDGTKKAVGQDGEFLEFHLYPEVDFTIMNLDDFYDDLVSSGLLL